MSDKREAPNELWAVIDGLGDLVTAHSNDCQASNAAGSFNVRAHPYFLPVVVKRYVLAEDENG